MGSESHYVFLCINIWVLSSRKLTYLTSLKGIFRNIICLSKSARVLVFVRDMGSFCFGGYPKVVGTPQLCRVDHAGVSNLKDDSDTPYNLTEVIQPRSEIRQENHLGMFLKPCKSWDKPTSTGEFTKKFGP